MLTRSFRIWLVRAKTSTTASASAWSSRQSRAMNAPVRPTPALAARTTTINSLLGCNGKIHLHSAAFANSTSEALSSKTGLPCSLGGSRPSPHTRTSNSAAIHPHVALVCHLKGLQLCNQHGLLLIYRPWRDGRLSWSGWLTYSG